MKQLVITKTGAPDVLQVQDAPDPTAGPGEVLVQVKFAGINFADILARQGYYPDGPKLPAVVGYEVSGTVKAVGEGVNKQLIGKRVLALTKFKGQAELVVAKRMQVFELPEQLSFEAAAAIPVNYLTAYGMLVGMGSLQKGEHLLVHNAGGGVGLAALDIARHIGAVTYGTSSPKKHDFLRQRGYNFLIDYRNHDWTEKLNDITEGKGVHLIIDAIGGDHWKKSYKALRHTGRLGMYGISSVTESKLWGKLRLVKLLYQMPKFGPLDLLDKNRGVFGFNLGHLWHEQEKVKEWADVLLKGVEEGWVQPHVDKIFPLAEGAEAHAYIEARKNIGKVLLEV